MEIYLHCPIIAFCFHGGWLWVVEGSVFLRNFSAFHLLNCFDASIASASLAMSETPPSLQSPDFAKIPLVCSCAWSTVQVEYCAVHHCLHGMCRCARSCLPLLWPSFPSFGQYIITMQQFWSALLFSSTWIDVVQCCAWFNRVLYIYCLFLSNSMYVVLSVIR